MNENVKNALRAIAKDKKLLEKFKGIGNPETIELFKDFKNLNESTQVSIDDLIGLFDDYHEGNINTEDIFGTDMCTQGTDGTCTLTVCSSTK